MRAGRGIDIMGSMAQPHHSPILLSPAEEAHEREIRAWFCWLADRYGSDVSAIPLESARKVLRLQATLEVYTGRRQAARLRAVDAEIAAKLRELERQVKARERQALARARAAERKAEREAEARDKEAFIARVRDAYEAACDLRRDGIAVGESVVGGTTPYTVPMFRTDRRRNGRLPHEEDGGGQSWDDAVRLMER